MYIPIIGILLVVLFLIILILYCRRLQQQIRVLKLGVRAISDFSKESLDVIYNERLDREGGDNELVPFLITDRQKDWEKKVNWLLGLFSKYKITSFSSQEEIEILMKDREQL